MSNVTWSFVVIFGALVVVSCGVVGFVWYNFSKSSASGFSPRKEDLSLFFLCMVVQVQPSGRTPNHTGFEMGGHYLYIS